MSLNLNYSNLALILEYPILMLNYFDYFLPSLLSNKTVYDINEIISLNPRGTNLSLGNDVIIADELNNYKINVSTIGSYDITQTLLSTSKVTETIFVKLSTNSSDFSKKNTDVLTVNRPKSTDTKQLTVYLGIILFCVIVVEKYFNSKETL